MKPILFESNEKAFTSYGLGTLECVSCFVEEERNGSYELEMEAVLTGQHIPDVSVGRIILAKPNRTDDPQPFRIYNVVKALDGSISISARHISYDLSGVILTSFTRQSCGEALSAMATQPALNNEWTFTTDRGSISGTFSTKSPGSCRSWLGGRAGSILDVYGPGDWHFDKFTCEFLTSRGEDRGATIRYGKNLTALKAEVDSTNVYSDVMCYYESDETVVKGSKVSTGQSALIRTLLIDKTGDYSEAVPTATQLTNDATNYIASHNLTAPKSNIVLDWAQSGEIIDRIDLCDTVSVIYEDLGVTGQTKCIRTRWDVLLDRYDEIEFGDVRNTLADTINSTDAKISTAMKEVQTGYSAAIQAASDIITGCAGGYVVFWNSTTGQPGTSDNPANEILIMNTASIDTATKVWRWNKNGLGYSETGYQGPFQTAITNDGTLTTWFIDTVELNADKITTGTLNADRIAAGSISVDKLTSTAKGTLVTSSATETQYYLSSSSSSATGGSWSTSVPTWSSGKYIWTRTKTTNTYASGTETISYAPSSSGTYDKALTTALSYASTAQDTASGANSQEQLIYKSAVSGTTSMAATTTWITRTTDSQNAWTLKRPTYSSNYPVLFVATQRKSVGGTVTCTTPIIDDTTTVIDGGHITTGTIDAGTVNVTNINADNITAGTLSGRAINNGNGTFSVDSSGNLIANAGTIAGWNIYKSSSSAYLYKDTPIDENLTTEQTQYRAGMNAPNSPGSSNRTFYLRHRTTSDGGTTFSSWVDDFAVFYDGRCIANKGVFKGEINAEQGTFSGPITLTGSITANLSGGGTACIDQGGFSITDSGGLTSSLSGGGLLMRGHDSVVGATYTTQLDQDISLSASTTTCTRVLSLSLKEGRWIIFGYVAFSGTSTSARRVATISTTSGAYSAYMRNDTQTNTSEITTLEVSGILNFSGTKTYYLNAGSSVACTVLATASYLYAIRIQ